MARSEWISVWNDDPNRTLEEVLGTMRGTL